jgi:hypothetical protein
MDDSRDEQFEVLDVGGRRGGRGGTDPELPAIQLDDQPPEPRGDRSPTWRQAGVVLGAMVLAAVGTTLVLDARDEAAESVAAGRTVDLIVGDVLDTSGITPGQGRARLTATVYNAGPRDVDVLSIHPTGWTIPADVDPNSRTAAVGEWASISMDVVPDCDGPVPPTTVEAAIRTEAGEHAVTLETNGAESQLGWIRDVLCSPPLSELYVHVERIDLLPTEIDDLPMRLFVQAYQAEGVVISDVTTGTPGFDVDVVERPEALSSGPRLSEVDVIWSVTDCADATTFDHADVEFDVSLKGEVASSGGELPIAAVAALARYAHTVCDD